MAALKSAWWADHTSGEIAALDKQRLVAVLPVAATEQHGPHLPVSVDTDLVNAVIARSVELRDPQAPVLFLPLLPYGKSNEHSRYPGTLSLSAQTLLAAWADIAAGVAASGVRRLVLLNGHGGQAAAMDLLARDLRERHHMLVVVTSWYQFGLPAGLFDPEGQRDDIHAGEVETSMMMACAPRWLRLEHARDFRSRAAQLRADGFSRVSLQGPGKLAWQVHDLNPLGATGNAAAATTEKGQAVIDHSARGLNALLDEVGRLPLDWLDQQPELIS